MARTTIDFGIDLGTTNSAIAIMDGKDVRIIPNSAGSSFTPSAVWIDKRGNYHVGAEAKQRYELDQDNCDIEFKLRMGSDKARKKHFVDSDVSLSPEDLSAEILKCLKADVQVNLNEAVQSAVVTIPAAFELHQNEATRKAAELAGLQNAPLLIEPVAAALAYGFEKKNENVFWLVFDFGGGTFDAAVIQVKDGAISVVNHAGDNYLGGKLIDWEIVEKLFIPALKEKYSLVDLSRSESKWRSTIAKLKNAAERAKVEVSRKNASYDLWIDDLCKDDDGKTVEFEFQLDPSVLREIVTPYIARALTLAKKALKESGLSGADLEKVLMVGGTTLIPWTRSHVQDELGAPLEFSIDPITVVARGAAIYAASKRLEVSGDHSELADDEFKINLEYDPVGIETEPEILAKIVHPKGESLEGYSVEIVDKLSQWKIKTPLLAKGVFHTNILADANRRCEYKINLYNKIGTLVKALPDEFTYTIRDQVMNKLPISHSVGVSMGNNQVDVFIKKGTPLPTSGRSIHQTLYPVRPGEKNDVINIPVVEGEKASRADRNQKIGNLVILSEQISREIPVGSDIEISIHINESRLVTTKAYIPVVDEEFETVIKLERETKDIDALKKESSEEKERLNKCLDKSDKIDDPKAKMLLAQMNKEQILQQTEGLLNAAEGDHDALSECDTRLLQLKASIDEVEDALEWPTVLKESQENIKFVREQVAESKDSEDIAYLEELERELQQAIASQDVELLRQKTKEIRSFELRIIMRSPGFWVGSFNNLKDQLNSMQNTSRANNLIEQGQDCIQKGNVEGLKTVVYDLNDLLPTQQQDQALGGYKGTTIKR